MKPLINSGLAKLVRTVPIVCLLALSGCAVNLKYGALPPIDNIDSLTIGESTRSDVVVALGQPRGNGMARTAQDPDPREIWFYEYLESDGKDAKFDMLIVFMTEDHFDGYLWFSSIREREQEGLFDPDFSAGYFPPVSKLESGLTRGQSSSMDVLSMLGEPTGSGSALLPPAHVQQDVMYYEDIEVTDFTSVGGMDFVAEMRQRILLVFIEEDKYDGFMWYSNAGYGEVIAGD